MSERDLQVPVVRLDAPTHMKKYVCPIQLGYFQATLEELVGATVLTRALQLDCFCPGIANHRRVHESPAANQWPDRGLEGQAVSGRWSDRLLGPRD
jgi:hypothetical protein